ncbi:apolipoprotein N-acyltransferase [Rhizobium sp. TRM95111]|uniref:apolipoprotein N-acyltransferase n=1 Tax=Rhizobium alarense TaxID=2846851 RepID=UPI001F22A78E|nr:apolipoprotein N-acyltransferase [Rhizobium alarense]MCF3639185.1 apolipoprotein N-acyltransferase [Rhizobium alarense]
MERLAGGVMLLSGWRRALMAFSAGLIGVVALPPFGFFAALFLSFTILVWLVDGATGEAGSGWVRRLLPAFWIGWFFGFGYFLGGLWWLGNALLVEAEDYAWALPLAVLGLPAFLALYYGLATAAARLLWSDGAGRLAALAVAFAAAEWLRGTLFTGFPWNAVGYGLMPVPLMMQSVKLAGMDAMNLMAVFVFASPALLGTRRGARRGLALAGVALVAHLGYGVYELRFSPDPAATGTGVRIVQPVIDQAMKLDDTVRAEIFERHLALTAAPPGNGGRKPEIVIWPETSIPFILTDNPDALVRIAEVLDDDQTLIAGAVRMEAAGAGKPPRYYNSIYAIDGKGQIIGAADKVHLVPFGEYMPFGPLLESWGINAVAAMPGGFSAAREHPLLRTAGGRSFYPLICYEAIFPQEITADAAQSDALLNLTNDAWFGNTPGPYQHFRQAQVRAVQTGVPLVRAANSGISAFVDSKGRVVLGLSYNIGGYIDSTLSGSSVSYQDIAKQNLRFYILLAMALLTALVSRFGFIRAKN